MDTNLDHSFEESNDSCNELIRLSNLAIEQCDIALEILENIRVMCVEWNEQRGKADNV
jgi:hypothetical protein